MSGMTWRSRRLVFAKGEKLDETLFGGTEKLVPSRRTGIFPGRVPRHLTLMSSIMSGGFQNYREHSGYERHGLERAP